MSDIPQYPTPPSANSGLDLRTLAHVAYGLYAIGFITGGIGTLAAVILAYIKRGDAAGTIYSTHFDWLLGTFWWSLLWIVLSMIGTFILLGYLGFAITLVWVLYRIVKGWLALSENRAVATVG